jgi:rRNA maturation endonuclease Nob1
MRCLDEGRSHRLRVMRVLDTAALLYWPMDKLAGGICAESQKEELEKVSAQRSMLIGAADIDWRDVTQSWLQEAKVVAAKSGDLPRLSNVDLDLLALTIALDATLYTDDYRLQNAVKNAGGKIENVGQSGAKKVWRWHLRCEGCRKTIDVPANVDRSKKGPVAECDICGSAMHIKRKS